MHGEPTLLVSAGEGSGDAMAAPVIERLGVTTFGLGGPALAGAGSELVADTRRLAAMGVGAAALKAPAAAVAARALLARARKTRPRAALLVGYSEFNAWLGARLRDLGTRVLWYAPPQIWAWRAGRAHGLRRSCDRMACVLPFEPRLWREQGVDAKYVGHPALERPNIGRDVARERFGMTPYAEYVAVLPGSRAHELREHLGPMLEAVAALRADRGAVDARVVLAPWLPRKLAARAAEEAGAAGVSCIESSAPPVLSAFDVALAASGTVTLECAVAGVPPVIAYRTGPVTELLARRLLTVHSIGLPNIVLGERVFPELVQKALTSDALAEEAGRLLDDRELWRARCESVRERLLPRDGRAASPSERVAELIAPWLG